MYRYIHVWNTMYNWSRSWRIRLFKAMLNTYIAMQGMYRYMQSSARALLWKAEFVRIVTSCTWCDIHVCTGTCRFMSVPYYSMVGTTMELCCHNHYWVHTISCHFLKINVRSLRRVRQYIKSQCLSLGLSQGLYVLIQTWYILLCTDTDLVYTITEEYVLTNTWYILVCTETNLLHTIPGKYVLT
jgi:hypothetical protein